MIRRSKGEYPLDWRELATQIKTGAGWRCVRCKEPHNPERGYCLTVHHLDIDPSNCHWWNLAALCQRCHLKIQAKVVMERPWIFEHSAWFKPFVAGRNAFVRGLPHDRDYVMAHLEELLK